MLECCDNLIFKNSTVKKKKICGQLTKLPKHQQIIYNQETLHWEDLEGSGGEGGGRGDRDGEHM